jgi:hypothetical protein
MQKSQFESTLKNIVIAYVSTCSRTLYETRATHRYDNQRFSTYDARIFLSSFCEAVTRNFDGDTKANNVFEIMKQTAKHYREFCPSSLEQTTTDALLVDFTNYVMREHCKAKFVLFTSEIEGINL